MAQRIRAIGSTSFVGTHANDKIRIRVQVYDDDSAAPAPLKNVPVSFEMDQTDIVRLGTGADTDVSHQLRTKPGGEVELIVEILPAAAGRVFQVCAKIGPGTDEVWFSFDVAA